MFIERDREKESNESSIFRHQMRNYYEIHRTNIFGVRMNSLLETNKQQSIDLFFFSFRMHFNRYKIFQQQHGKIPFELVLSINKV